MNSPWIQALRSVALTVPDLAAAEAFYTQVWRLAVAARTDSASTCVAAALTTTCWPCTPRPASRNCAR